MSQNPYKWKWKYKPPVGSQLDRSHPLAQGLEAFWILNEGAGNIVTDLVTGSSLSLYGGAALKNSQLVLNGANQYAQGLGPVLSGKSLTLIARHTPSTLATANICPISMGSAASGQDSSFSFRIISSTSIGISQYADDDAVTVPTMLPGVAIHSALTINTNLTRTYYHNGIGQSDTAHGLFAGTNNFNLGATNQGAIYWPYPGQIDYGMVYERALTKTEIASLCADSYQMIAPPPGLIFTSLPSGAITLYSLLDTGSETDALLDVLAALANADSSTASDARSATGFGAVGDSGVAYDTLTGIFKPAYLESGAGTDALTGSGTGAQADAISAGVDAIAAIGSGAKADSGAGTDGLNFSLILGLSDSSSVSDILALLPGAMLLSDLGDVADAPLMPGIYLLSDDAVVSDSLSVLGIVVGAADAGATGSALSAVIGSLGVSDALHGSDGLAMTMGAVGELDATGATFSGLIVRVHGVGVGIAAFTFGGGFIDGSAFGGNIN